MVVYGYLCSFFLLGFLQFTIFLIARFYSTSYRASRLNRVWVFLKNKKMEGEMSVSLRKSSFLIYRIPLYSGDESAFHMYYKLAQLEHYIVRDTPRKTRWGTRNTMNGVSCVDVWSPKWAASRSPVVRISECTFGKVRIRNPRILVRGGVLKER